MGSKHDTVLLPCKDGSHRCPVVLLAQDGPLTRIVWHALERDFGRVPLVIEESVPVLQLLRRRVKSLGIIPVLGQVLFRSVIYPPLAVRSKNRVRTIKAEFGLDDSPVTGPILSTRSVNSDSARLQLKELDPVVVVVCGTRIIGKQTLSSLRASFINMHAGITPLYRGVHGGYWALAEGHPELVGTTIHRIDEGIDTGGVIEQGFFNIRPEDSFATYPYLHVGTGIPLLVKAVRCALDGGLAVQQDPVPGPSRLWYHPTFWGYLATRIGRGVR